MGYILLQTEGRVLNESRNFLQATLSTEFVALLLPLILFQKTFYDTKVLPIKSCCVLYLWNIIWDLGRFGTVKGQLISECLFDVLNFPKKQRKIWQISALEFKKWSNNKIKANYIDFDTNYVQIILNIIRRCLYFVDLTTFYILGQKFVKFFVGFLENLRLSKRHSETNWPLARSKSQQHHGPRRIMIDSWA